MLKEEISMFQDAKNNKTTIVIRNMKKSTRDAIGKLLLGDLKAEEITGLEEIRKEDPVMNSDVNEMEPVLSPADLMPEPETPDTKKIESEYAATMQALWVNYNEEHPEILLQQFLSRMLGSKVKEERIAAGTEAGNLLNMFVENRRVIQYLLWGIRNLAPFAEVAKSLIRQKGCGDGLVVGTQQYDNCLLEALQGLTDEELRILVQATARELKK